MLIKEFNAHKCIRMKEIHSLSTVPKNHKLNVEMHEGSQLGDIKRSHKNVLSVLTSYLLTYLCSILTTSRDKAFLVTQTTEKMSVGQNGLFRSDSDALII